ncbi:hypothetical protein Scep_014868 [Stephania cephalantha]|uniref:Auxin response factor n=1 Tax=Stephania cephalantha TaxID=152367 RepID=A0AAP0NZU4_9MAGN
MITFTDSARDQTMREGEKCLDSQLWHACAGGMVQMPTANSKVFYFPQGHAEHANGNVDFGNSGRVPALILCRVTAVKFMADTETDEVYAKIRMVPMKSNEIDHEDEDDGGVGNNGNEAPDKPASFAKTLTQSDANNGGGFSVPRYCAETIFPRLDYSADPPVQTVVAKDVHGESWKFRHIYRGTPRRHLLTTGWSTFVNQKKLIAGDSIVFLRAENGVLCVGIRRAKRGVGGGTESPSGWNPAVGNCVSPFGGFSMFLREDENKLMRNVNGGGNSNSGGGARGRARVRPESVIESATLAASGQPFEVIYYPRASTPEFCVKASSVKAAMQIRWCSGMRFKMAFETEDSSRISWFMGTISSVQVADPIRWPGSPWRLLQVTWDEPDLLQNVKRVSPWLVELVSNMPTIHLSPFSPPRKKLRLPQHPDFPFDGQLTMPSLSSNPSGPAALCVVFQTTFLQAYREPGMLNLRLHHAAPPPKISLGNCNSDENVSCLLTMGSSTESSKKPDNKKTAQFILFGQPILTEQQISLSSSGDTVSAVITGNSSSDGNPEKANLSDNSGSGLHLHGLPESSPCEGFPWYKEGQSNELGLETGHCKVFMESEDVGRTLDLSVLKSYDELYRKLGNMFDIEKSETLSHLLYRNAKGEIKHTGDEPFSEFMKATKRLTIVMDSGSDNIGRAWALKSAGNEINSSSKTGPLSISA